MEKNTVYVEEFGELEIIDEIPSGKCRYVGTAYAEDTSDEKEYDLYEKDCVWYAVKGK